MKMARAKTKPKATEFQVELRVEAGILYCFADGVRVARHVYGSEWVTLSSGWRVENEWVYSPNGNSPAIVVQSPDGNLAQIPVELVCNCDPPCVAPERMS
jgi:hypothetical protein